MMTPQRAKEVLKRATRLYSLQEIDAALDRMAKEVTAVMGDEYPLVLSVMTGGIFITAGLALRLDIPVEIDYVHATRYQGTLRAGDLHWRIEPRLSLKERTVLILDDILDGGLTLGAITNFCHAHEAKTVYTGVLLDKAHCRDPGGLAKADFTGLHVEDRYVFGYGLDYEEYLRNVPGIYAVADEDIG